MTNVWFYTLLSVFIVSLVSFVGVLTLLMTHRKLHELLLYFVSFSAGALFGDAFLHLLPTAAEKFGFSVQLSLYVLAGLVFSFAVEKLIRWRHCHVPHSHKHVHPFAIMNLVGDAVHNFIDGIIIAVSYLVSLPVGLATTLAVVLHEIPQEIGDFGILLHGGFSKAKALFFNFITALAAFGGAILALVFTSYVANVQFFVVPFAAGQFIYIAGSDLIPELHKEIAVKDSLIQFLFFVAGVLVMLALLLLE
ncbi:ZIP family metal transporter [Candidatus Woesearchaeota archaeon]|nr:ZIP family metal transporter [Candidatus Woesearchaeota archaeon]